MPFTISQPQVTIEPGTYPATLEKVVEGTHPTYGPNRQWHWLVEVNDKLEAFMDFTSANTGSGTNTYKRLTALLGRAPAAGETVEDPTGTRVLLQIGKNDKGFPKVDDGVPR
jgi:hypothetical protein